MSGSKKKNKVKDPIRPIKRAGYKKFGLTKEEWEDDLESRDGFYKKTKTECRNMSRQFVKNFKYLCKKNGLSMVEVSDRIYDHDIWFSTGRLNTLSNVYGKHVNIVEMVAVATFFGVDSGRLVTADLEAHDELVK